MSDFHDAHFPEMNVIFSSPIYHADVNELFHDTHCYYTYRSLLLVVFYCMY